MNVKDIVEYGVYSLNNNLAELVEVMKKWDEDNLVKVRVHANQEVITERVVTSDELFPIELSEDILKALSFLEVNGKLWGLIDEHYFFLKAKDVVMIKNNGIFNYVSADPKSYYGCRFIPMPYLHQLQNLIGRINVDLLINIHNHATSTT